MSTSKHLEKICIIVTAFAVLLTIVFMNGKRFGIESISGANGYEERDALLDCLRGLDERACSVLCCDWRNRGGDPPIAAFVWREA